MNTRWRRSKGERRVAGATEEEIYAKLELDFIPPELRENTRRDRGRRRASPAPTSSSSRTFAATCRCTPRPATARNSIEEMAAAARALGYEYIASPITARPSPSPTAWTKSARSSRSRKIHAANATQPGIRILAGSEVDILKDGRLDLDDEVLAQLDVVVVSVHSYMNLERAEMTERILAAIENPYTQIIGHPTGRLLLRRDAFAYDMERILDAARKHGVAMECNASPERLDLKDAYLRMAKERGVRVVISTDAHTTRGLGPMRYGVQMARRGWIEKKDVLNTLPVEKLLAALRPKPGAAARQMRPTPDAARQCLDVRGNRA